MDLNELLEHLKAASRLLERKKRFPDLLITTCALLLIGLATPAVALGG